MKPHQKLEVWRRSFRLVVDLYRLTSSFPSEEKFGIISQIRRAAVSVPVNISEGAARQTKKEFVQFLYIASGSLSELDTLILLSDELEFIKDKEQFTRVYAELESITKMLMGLINSVKQNI
ncbi:four helix bundle protein [Solitalea sp. MAHUQ-68]|uniref:Four helix bundle protein n=1 Tax=Solitalea agri TaxID=2953739 RepID=A0A9X2F4X0_9SPHI|nr:four helix bundle protein [Solitalea agri]MCO4294285.1 four helix bundle protein [Solitalea agri]